MERQTRELNNKLSKYVKSVHLPAKQEILDKNFSNFLSELNIQSEIDCFIAQQYFLTLSLSNVDSIKHKIEKQLKKYIISRKSSIIQSSNLLLTIKKQSSNLEEFIHEKVQGYIPQQHHIRQNFQLKDFIKRCVNQFYKTIRLWPNQQLIIINRQLEEIFQRFSQRLIEKARSDLIQYSVFDLDTIGEMKTQCRHLLQQIVEKNQWLTPLNWQSLQQRTKAKLTQLLNDTGYNLFNTQILSECQNYLTLMLEQNYFPFDPRLFQQRNLDLMSEIMRQTMNDELKGLFSIFINLDEQRENIPESLQECLKQ